MQTPYYLIDKSHLKKNMEKIAWLRDASGAKSLLALKCFATWSVFDFMSQYMDGSTSSSLYEVRLGAEKFGGETHAYSVAYADHEIEEVLTHSDKIIFNSIGQLTRFDAASQDHVRGLRVNPGCQPRGLTWRTLRVRSAVWANMTLTRSPPWRTRSAG